MTHRNAQSSTLFAGLPRRRGGLLAAPLMLLCLALGVGFAFEVMPVRSPQDRFYDLEAERDFLVRAAARKQAMLAAEEAARHAVTRRVQARTPSTAPRIGSGATLGALSTPGSCVQAR